MQIFVPRENEKETRVAITPDTVKKFVKLGLEVQIEKGAGLKSLFRDEDYASGGAQIVASEERVNALSQADIILHLS